MGDGHRPVIGFDFGTSTTLVAADATLVWIGTTTAWMPSLVGYDDDGSVVVGEEAAFARPGQVIRSVKRTITERRSRVRVEAPYGVPDVSADDLMAAVLRKAVRRASVQDVDVFDPSRLYLGCPAMWDGRQRRRLLDVAHQVGLPVTLATLVDEPVAAGIAWLAGHPSTEPLRVLVFDMGGGTLDIAVLDVLDHREISVLAAVSLAEAGDALDDTIAEDLDYALGATGVDVDALDRPDLAWELLLDAARKVKIGLTTEVEFPIVLPPDMFGPNEIWYTREQLNVAFAPQLDLAQEYVAAALRVAHLTSADPGSAAELARRPIEDLVSTVDVVVLSGGMSQVPYVRARLRDLFPPTTRLEFAGAAPELAVVLGLARAAEFSWTNAFRPAFDVLLEYEQQSRVVYEAYQPLVQPWQVARGDRDLRFVRTAADLSLPADGTGKLRLVCHSSEPLVATLDGASLDGFPVAFGEEFEFSIYPNGRIRVVDAAGLHHGNALT